MVSGAPCYDDRMSERQQKLVRASQAAAKARTLAKRRRWAQELREAGWKVEEPNESE